MVDTSIAMGYRPIQLDNPMSQYAMLAQLQQTQQANALNQLKMQEYQRGVEEQNALRAAITPNFDPTNPEHVSAVYKAAPTLAPKLVENALLAKKTGADISKTEDEVLKSRLGTVREVWKNVQNPDDAVRVSQSVYQDPVLGKTLRQLGGSPEAALREIQVASQNPDTWQKYLQKQQLTADKFAELSKPHTFTENLRGVSRIVSQGGLGGPLQVLSETPMSLAPGEAERIGLERQRVGLEAQRVGMERKRLEQQLTTELPVKEIQKREAALPQATMSVKNASETADGLITQLKTLRDHPGLSNITGTIAGRTPSLTGDASSAQALLDTITAKGQFQMLQNLRNASKTGGALGNISDKEGAALKAAFGALDRRQSTADFQKAIDDVIADVERAKRNTVEAYDQTYEYRSGRTAPAAAAPTAKPAAAPKVVDFGSLK